MAKPRMRVMSIMAHQDDFEFNAGGSFALLRETLGDSVDLKILATTRGATGHHIMTPDETFERRGREAAKSASLIGASYECLTLLDGSHPPAQVYLDRDFLGGVWNAMRAFEPDVVFCPPVVNDPLAGVHIDHLNTAHAVRLVAYQVVVPNAYPTMNGPRKQYVPSPLIINVDDTYARESDCDIRQDIRSVYAAKERMGLCHESQIFEWLPFAGGKKPPTRAEWRKLFRQRHQLLNDRYGKKDGVVSEYFRVTRWGRPPKDGELERLFPKRMK